MAYFSKYKIQLNNKQGFRQECLRGGSKMGGGSLGFFSQEKKKSDFLIFSDQNGLFQLK